MQDVADTLRALEADARDLRAEAAAEDLASKSLEITKKQFAAGGVSHVQLLIAERQYSQARQNRVLPRGRPLFRFRRAGQALGSGWWMRKDQRREGDQAVSSVMRWRLIIVLGAAVVLLGALGFNLILKPQFIEKFKAQNTPKAGQVSTTVVAFSDWQPEITAVGTMRAFRGVVVTPRSRGWCAT